MSFIATILGLGFLLGLRHATDADHVVAITAITSRENGIRKSSLVGALWGIGHSITVTLIATPIIFFSLVIPDRIGLGLEFVVGLMLVFLGVSNFFGITHKISKRFAPKIHKHEHIAKRGNTHSHLHAHFFIDLKNEIHHLGIYHSLRPIIIGLIHGLAGSSAVALLILSTINNPQLATLYLLIFHIGVIIGMMLITTVLGISIAAFETRSQKIHNYLVLSSGILSFVFGLMIMYETGIQGGLFSGLSPAV